MISVPRRILAPVDFTPGSEAAIEYALFLARSLGARVTLFHVHDRGGALSAIVPGADAEADLQVADQRSLQRLDLLRHALGPDGSGIDRAVAAGDPAEQILGHAAGFDLIVMGTHGRMGVERILVGSVAETVLRRATIPVLIVHLPESP